jgi:hypothetical protein
VTGTRGDDEPLFEIGGAQQRRARATVSRSQTDRWRAGALGWSAQEDYQARPASAQRVRLIVGGAGLLTAVLGWLLAGTLGVFIVVSAALVVALLLLRAQLPRGPRSRRRQRRPVPFLNAEFPAYRRIEDTLFWAPVSARHFDHAVRPLLARLLAAVLAERHGVDMATNPAQARAAIGDDLWPLVDPERPVSDDTRAPGVPLPVVLRFLDRLEALGGETWSGPVPEMR